MSVHFEYRKSKINYWNSFFFLICRYSSTNDYRNLVSRAFRGCWAEYQSSRTWSISFLISIKQHYQRRNLLVNCQVLPSREAVFTRGQRLSKARITIENAIGGAYNKNSLARVLSPLFPFPLSPWSLCEKTRE